MSELLWSVSIDGEWECDKKCIEYAENTSACEFIIQRLSVSTAVTVTIILTNVCGKY
jgi:hypothetical protein